MSCIHKDEPLNKTHSICSLQFCEETCVVKENYLICDLSWDHVGNILELSYFCLLRDDQETVAMTFSQCFNISNMFANLLHFW